MIGRNLYFEDVKQGDELPPFEEPMTTIEMNRYAAATWDFSRAHYDQEYVKSRGLPNVFVDGQMEGAFMARLVGEWAGDPCCLRKLNIQYRQMLFPGDTIVCKGKVERTYTQEGRNLVECDLTVERKKDSLTAAVGRAIVELPSRRKA